MFYWRLSHIRTLVILQPYKMFVAPTALRALLWKRTNYHPIISRVNLDDSSVFARDNRRSVPDGQNAALSPFEIISPDELLCSLKDCLSIPFKTEAPRFQFIPRAFVLSLSNNIFMDSNMSKKEILTNTSCIWFNERLFFCDSRSPLISFKRYDPNSLVTKVVASSPIPLQVVKE